MSGEFGWRAMVVAAVSVVAVAAVRGEHGPAPQPVVVRTDGELRAALASLGPGSVLRLAPGRYQPGVTLRDRHGTAGRPIVIEGLDPRDPPIFEGGSQAWHLSDVSHLVMRRIHCRGQRHNGINVDDGGSFETPSRHVTLEHLIVEDVGPQGNFDAIKCSGVDHLRIIECRIAIQNACPFAILYTGKKTASLLPRSHRQRPNTIGVADQATQRKNSSPSPMRPRPCPLVGRPPCPPGRSGNMPAAPERRRPTVSEKHSMPSR